MARAAYRTARAIRAFRLTLSSGLLDNSSVQAEMLVSRSFPKHPDSWSCAMAVGAASVSQPMKNDMLENFIGIHESLSVPDIGQP
ncbi:hypothetical protein MexAM1_META2pCDS603974R (plasmid) [Methylorubrum extorquens AM1]|uniref:Uncharacterized protein n=1 Tax=Methylorubrum extorquens (strain ATCC 14718 / DSM 1338 / JCM 2805 / NCIMB 9133 / AM1) TaxID=272630 RepID=C5B4W3_METEA|nr:hypothetical protein MexAM1_META2pCDS603974R [Methylorubrum extorquens AM1]